MTNYILHGVNLSDGQAEKIYKARRNNEAVSIRLSKSDLNGQFKIPLTKRQFNKIIKSDANGLDLKLSALQLKHLEKSGGFIPLLSLIPLLAGVASGVGGLAGGIGSIVNGVKKNQEEQRHNRAIEEQLKTGTGVISDLVDRIPLLGKLLSPYIRSIGLGIKDINGLNDCECQLRKLGYGLYLGPPRDEGSGLFLDPNA
jgi:hypothetical protein